MSHYPTFYPERWHGNLATDVNRGSTSTVFSDLRLVETAFRLPAGSASFGRSVVDFERWAQVYQVQAAYGLTHRLSLGVRMPYWHQTIAVEGSVDTRTATVGFNPSHSIAFSGDTPILSPYARSFKR